MATAVSYPGVYIEEVPSGVRTITGVATSITAFVGTAKQGPIDTPIRIQSFADFERTFGGLEQTSLMSYAVSHFFANGGTDALVVRVVHDAKPARPLLPYGDPNKPDDDVALVAKYAGAWGNSLRVTVDHDTKQILDENGQVNVGETAKLFNLFIRDTASGKTEAHRNISIDPNSPRFAVDVLEEESTLVRFEGNSPQRPDAIADIGNPFSSRFPTRFTKGTATGVNLPIVGGASMQLSKKEPAATENLWVRVEHIDGSNDEYNMYLFDKTTGTVVEEYEKVSHVEKVDVDGTESDNPQFIKTVLASSSWLEVPADVAEGRPVAHSALPGPGVDPFNYSEGSGSSAIHAFVKIDPNDTSAAGVDGDGPVTESDIVGRPSEKTGIYALEDADLFNLLCIPPLLDTSATPAQVQSISPTTYKTALKFCLDNRAFLVVDAPSDWESIADAEQGVNDMRSILGATDAKNSAVFFPQFKMADPLRENRTGTFAPCGTVAGIMAKTDATRGVWKAPAGIEAAVGGVRELTVKMTDGENGRLNPLAVNCIRSFPVYGNVVWGSRTLAGADALTSEWKYLPVRRFTLFLEESLYRGTQWVVFEPNDEPLWAQIRQNVGAFMQGLFRKGAFQGQTAKQAYFVKCDSTTTTQNDINQGIVNIEVGFAPLKPAEFVVIKIQQIAGDIDT